MQDKNLAGSLEIYLALDRFAKTADPCDSVHSILTQVYPFKCYVRTLTPAGINVLNDASLCSYYGLVDAVNSQTPRLGNVLRCTHVAYMTCTDLLR